MKQEDMQIYACHGGKCVENKSYNLRKHQKCTCTYSPSSFEGMSDNNKIKTNRRKRQ
jgi:hypothetical protein